MIVTGNIDLSVGKLAGFVSVVVAYFQATVWYQMIPDQPLIAAALSVLIGVVVGVLWGVLQGYIIAFMNVPAFIVTLGGMFVLNGLILLVTQGKTIPANQAVLLRHRPGLSAAHRRLGDCGHRRRLPVLEHVPRPPEQGAPRFPAAQHCAGSHHDDLLLAAGVGLRLPGQPVPRHPDSRAAAGDHGHDHGLCIQQHPLWPLRLRHRRQP